MGFKDMIETAKKASGMDEAIQQTVKDKMMGTVKEWLDDYKKAVAVLETFGFVMGKFTVSMAIIPEVSTSITGDIQRIHVATLKSMIEEHPGDKMLAALLHALIVAREIWEHMELKLNSATLHVTLGIPPHVSVEVH